MVPQSIKPRPGRGSLYNLVMEKTAMLECLLLFGATGDLTQRYLFPSLANLLRDRLLPPGFRVVAVARHPYSAAEFRAALATALAAKADIDPGAPEVVELLARTDYIAADLADPGRIATALASLGGQPCVSFLATPPSLFVAISQGLKAAGLLEAPSRLVLEKPIGRDLASAREIISAIGKCVDEDRVYRIDHYLGKAPVQNLLALRFGNALLEAVWNRQWIDSVDIVVAETAGVDGREGYYASYGALRDMVQNHILQLLCLIAMEPPSSLEADAVRNEKVKVLRALRPMNAAAAADSVRGRYESGVVGGRAAAGFHLPDGVPPTETFVALRAYLDNWRWEGVPFRLCTGKRLAQRYTQIVITFRHVSHWLFEKPSREKATPNRMVFRLQPEENIELGLMSSLAAPDWGALELQPLPLDLSMPVSPRRRIAYERLLLDALNGNTALFVRHDEVEAAWAWIDSVADAWTTAGTPILPYLAGSWGPAEAADFLQGAGGR
jgi:glucose-6-phosphate 1-dehydrogenase